jgi:hypothetical protein
MHILMKLGMQASGNSRLGGAEANLNGSHQAQFWYPMTMTSSYRIGAMKLWAFLTERNETFTLIK